MSIFQWLLEYAIAYLRERAGLTSEVEIKLAMKAMVEVRMKQATPDAADAFVDHYRRAFLKEQRAGLVDLVTPMAIKKRFIEFEAKLHQKSQCGWRSCQQRNDLHGMKRASTPLTHGRMPRDSETRVRDRTELLP